MTTNEIYQKLRPEIKKIVDEKCDINKYDGLNFGSLVSIAKLYKDGYSKLDYSDFTKGLNSETKKIFDEVYKVLLDNSSKK